MDKKRLDDLVYKIHVKTLIVVECVDGVYQIPQEKYVKWSDEIASLIQKEEHHG